MTNYRAPFDHLDEEARDRGDSWLLNLPRYRQFESQLNTPDPMSSMPATQSATPVYDPNAIRTILDNWQRFGRRRP